MPPSEIGYWDIQVGV